MTYTYKQQRRAVLKRMEKERITLGMTKREHEDYRIKRLQDIVTRAIKRQTGETS